MLPSVAGFQGAKIQLFWQLHLFSVWSGCCCGWLIHRRIKMVMQIYYNISLLCMYNIVQNTPSYQSAASPPAVGVVSAMV